MVERSGSREQILVDPDDPTRAPKQYAPLLNDIMENDPDSFCRDAAMHAAGVLKADENLPALLRLAQRGDEDQIWRLACELTEYATEECRPYLKHWFENVEEKSTRVIAAWGLGKLGEQDAIAYLVRMLEDPDLKGPNFSHPGESLRAAQALCDIYRWPFEWHTSYVEKTAARVKEAESGRSDPLWRE